MKDKILRIIPIVGVTLFAIAIICLLLCIWNYNPMLNLKITITSVIIIGVLRILDKALE